MTTDTTAMQELIKMWEESSLIGFNYWVTENKSELLSKEREQIEKAWEEGYYSNSENQPNSPSIYFNQTYNQ